MDGILPEGAEEMFEKFTMVRRAHLPGLRDVLGTVLGVLDGRNPTNGTGSAQTGLAFRDWLIYEFRYQLAPLMQIDAEELAEVRYQWIAAMEIISEDLYRY